MTTHEIKMAINEAESVASPLKKNNDPVTVTNKTLLALLEAANNSMIHGEDRD